MFEVFRFLWRKLLYFKVDTKHENISLFFENYDIILVAAYYIIYYKQNNKETYLMIYLV